MPREDLQITVPWQATAAFFGAFVAVPLVFAGCMFIFVEHGYMAREFGLAALAVASPFVLWAALALRSRLRLGRAAGESLASFVKQFLLALGIMLAAVVIGLMAQKVASATGAVYLVPCGLFLAGAVLFVRAMTPPKEN